MEQVVLLDQSHTPCGVMPKSEVHTANTPLHLAFSCYLLNANNELLLTRRSLDKKAWPGVWTNSFCGHPLPDEALSAAVHRRGQWEVGINARDIQLVDGTFKYEATDTNDIKENEYCPIFIARTDTAPRLNPEEAIDHLWLSIDKVLGLIELAPELVSPWMVLQMTRSNLREHLTGL